MFEAPIQAGPSYQPMAPPAPMSPVAAEAPKPVPLNQRPYFIPLLIGANVLILLLVFVLLYLLLRR